MTEVSGSGPAQCEFSFGDFARMRAIGLIRNGSRPRLLPRWNRVVGWGATGLADYAAILPARIGLNVFAADTAVTIGMPPNNALRLDGQVDAAAVRRKLTALGAKPRTFGATRGLSLAPDNKIELSSPLAKLGIINQLNQVAMFDDDFAASPNAATLQKVIDVHKSLADTGRYGALADCLGDVIAADIDPAPAGDRNAAAYGVGVRDPGSATGTDHEVVCVLPRSGRTGALTTALKRNFAPSATDAVTRIRMSQLLAKTVVDRSGPAVRATLTLRSSTAPGFVLAAVDHNAVATWTQ